MRGECPQDRHQVVEEQRGLATLAADGDPLLVIAPALGRPADDDVVLVRIDEHVANLREPGQVLHRFGNGSPFGQPLRDLFFEPRERDEPQRACRPQIGVEVGFASTVSQ